MKEEIDPLLSPKEVAAILNVHAASVWRLCSSGRIPAKNVSAGAQKKRWRVKASDLRAFLDAPDNPPATPTPAPPSLPPGVRQRA